MSPPPTGSRSWALPRPSGCWRWRTSGRSWSTALSRATRFSSARTPPLHPASRHSTPACGPPPCGATARPTTRPRKSSDGGAASRLLDGGGLEARDALGLLAHFTPEGLGALQIESIRRIVVELEQHQPLVVRSADCPLPRHLR